MDASPFRFAMKFPLQQGILIDLLCFLSSWLGLEPFFGRATLASAIALFPLVRLGLSRSRRQVPAQTPHQSSAAQPELQWQSLIPATET